MDRVFEKEFGRRQMAFEHGGRGKALAPDSLIDLLTDHKVNHISGRVMVCESRHQSLIEGRDVSLHWKRAQEIPRGVSTEMVRCVQQSTVLC